MKNFNQRLSKYILSCLLFLGLSLGFASPTAANSVKSVPFNLSNGAVNVATIYDTSLATQKAVVKSIKSSKALLKKALGFEGLSVLKSEDGTKIIFLSQWQDLASFQAYNTQPTATSDKSSQSSDTAAPPRIVVFEIVKTQARQGATPALRGKEAVVQLSEFTLKNPADQQQAIANIERMMPGILQKQPTPQSVILLRSINNTEVALLANWNCSADFEDIGQPAAFEPPNADLIALADNEQHRYDVVQLMAVKVKQPTDSKEFQD